ncbi:hypothetical protein L873DRAFT_1823711 [Choiromyces venosus 120613-1]|uniref:Alpha/beta-hydrolase n=1 Tax=Choiromyces venosus 120613-1 TaxID=1336337 RepID=A0A3N4IT84_9PEZI|nr:hypothetical protein L873DRAFT_1823711 [Choiromyces venosus 120613-1]
MFFGRRKKTPQPTWNGEGRPLAVSTGRIRNYSLPLASLVPHPGYSPRSDASQSLNLNEAEKVGEEEDEEDRGEGEYGTIVREDQPEDVQEIDAGYILSPVMSRAQSSAVYSSATWISSAGEERIEDVVPRPTPRLGRNGSVRSTVGVISPPAARPFVRYAAFANIPSTTPTALQLNLQNATRRRPVSGPASTRAPPPRSVTSYPSPPILPLQNINNNNLRHNSTPEPVLMRNGVTSIYVERPPTPPESDGDSFSNPRPAPQRPYSENDLRGTTLHIPGFGAVSDRKNGPCRTLSTTSSLGDDSRFNHITKNSNTWIRAIVDGLPVFTPPAAASEALDSVQGDVVVLGGYRGSVLRDLTMNNRRVWIPLKVGLNLRKVDLEVGLDPEDDEAMKERIIADGMLTNIGPVDVSKRLLKRLKSGAEENNRRVHDWGYDWRLSPKLLSQRLIEFLETLPCNAGAQPGVKRKKGQGALIIAHSLGGLITRHAINQRPELFSGVIFAGSPGTCVSILGAFRNGDEVMFNSKVFSAQATFSFRTSFVFLPEDGQCFIDRNTGKHVPLDFFNVDTWIRHCLSPCVSPCQLVTLPQSVPFPQSLPSPPPSSRASLDLFGALGEPPRRPPPKRTNSTLSNSSTASKNTLKERTDSKIPAPIEMQKCTLPLSKTISYLRSVLAETLQFKRGLDYDPVKDSMGLYPPMTVLYCKTMATVRGVWVDGKEGIREGSFEDLAFGAGDGVTLATQAQLPSGYKCTKRVAVDRGHVSLLTDLEGVGRCLEAIIQTRGW